MQVLSYQILQVRDSSFSSIDSLCIENISGITSATSGACCVVETTGSTIFSIDEEITCSCEPGISS